MGSGSMHSHTSKDPSSEKSGENLKKKRKKKS